MSIGFWQLGILILLFFPSLFALILCLILIKKRNYKKIPKNKIYAGFWHRFLAYLIDFIILAVIYFVLTLIPVIGWIIGIFFGWLYFAIQHSSSKRSTLGMRALDMTINDENLDKIGFWRATGNYLVVGISVIILFIGLIMIGFTSRKQGLHNLVSRTIHLKDK
ncbi:RDD family protein [Pelagibacteraceae bacterium]|nr:RDD family protein [Pelagibacteraceae bacterium]